MRISKKILLGFFYDCTKDNRLKAVLKINSINNITFGYSKKSQKYLDEHISTLDNKCLAKSLKECSKVCNDTEYRIKSLEKGKHISNFLLNDTYSSMKDILISMKAALLDQIASLFEDCDDYIKSEYDYYSSSLKKCKNKEGNWREGYIKELKYWNFDLGKTQEEIDEEIEQTKNEKKTTEQATDSDKNKDELEHIVKISEKKEDAIPLKKEGLNGITLRDVVGMDELKKELTEYIVEPLKDPKQAELDRIEYGIEMPKGILLYGPPGCGKTYIVDAISNETDIPVYQLSVADQGSKYVNETSKNIKKMFDAVISSTKESNSPAFIFMDEMDSITKNRSQRQNGEDIKTVATLLSSIEDAQKNNVIVIGASNKYYLIDPAIRRRFDLKSYVGLPDKAQRADMLRHNLSNKTKAKNLLKDDSAIEKIADEMEGYSYHSINIIANNASKRAKERNRADISIKDFIAELRETSEEKQNESEYKKADEKKIGFINKNL